MPKWLCAGTGGRETCLLRLSVFVCGAAKRVPRPRCLALLCSGGALRPWLLTFSCRAGQYPACRLLSHDVPPFPLGTTAPEEGVSAGFYCTSGMCGLNRNFNPSPNRTPGLAVRGHSRCAFSAGSEVFILVFSHLSSGSP